MTERKVERILATGASYVTSGDLGCLLNIGGLISRIGYPVKAIHLAEILAGKPEAFLLRVGCRFGGCATARDPPKSRRPLMELSANSFGEAPGRRSSTRRSGSARADHGGFLAHRDAAVAAFPEFEATASARRGSSGTSWTTWTRTLRASSRRRKNGARSSMSPGRGPGAGDRGADRAGRGGHPRVKSKSMAAEEISFNEALQGAGVTVVESDLGEFIIQLAGRRLPYHRPRGPQDARADLRSSSATSGSRAPTVSRMVGWPAGTCGEVPLRGMGVSAGTSWWPTPLRRARHQRGKRAMGTVLRASTRRRRDREGHPRMADLPTFLRLLRGAPPARRSRRTCRS